MCAYVCLAVLVIIRSLWALLVQHWAATQGGFRASACLTFAQDVCAVIEFFLAGQALSIH